MQKVFKKSDFEFAHMFKREGKEKQIVKVIFTDSKLTPKNISAGKFFTETGADRDIKIMIRRAISRLKHYSYVPFLEKLDNEKKIGEKK